MTWVDALGWLGSALLIYSLLQARILRLRVLNTVACVILIVFNALVGVWPMVAMNVVLAGINIFFIVRMLRERDDDQAYAVLPVHEDDAYLTHFLGVHRTDIDIVLQRLLDRHRHRPLDLPGAARRRDGRCHRGARRGRRRGPGRARLRDTAVP